MSKDPYLVQGVPCWVWDNWHDEEIVRCFWDWWEQKERQDGTGPMIPRFSELKNMPIGLNVYDNYYPIGTEWDFAPNWAVCSTVDSNGMIRFWNELAAENLVCTILGKWIRTNLNILDDNKSYFLCPDKSRYEGDAWRASLRWRPKWAKGGR